MKGMINKSKFGEIEFILPEYDKQKEFSNFFLIANDSLTIMRSQLEKLEENFQSVLHQAFTGRLQFPESKVDEYAIKR